MTILRDPRTGQARREVDNSDAVQVTAAVAAARAGYPGWAARPPAQRSRELLRLAEHIEDRVDDYVRAERAGTGKPEADARGEIAASVDVIRFYAGALRADQTPASGNRMVGRESWVRWEPLGVVAAIVPWNYPLLMAAWRVGPALAAGNAVVLKPAETTPDTALLLAEDVARALGPDVLVALPGDRKTGRCLVASDVDAIAFTGSHTGGLDVVANAGLRRVSLELGGNCPAIVLADAPDGAFDDIVRASVYNAGQSCAAPARVIAVREKYDETVERLAASMRACLAGVDFGPLNNPDQVARFDRILGASGATVAHVAQLRHGPDESGGYWRAGRVLAGLAEDDPAVVEEIFGPVLTVQAADGVADAVRLANGLPQALAASVWGTDVGRVLDIAGKLDCGEVWINCHLEQTPELPHGGRRRSGNGTDLSVLAISEYQRPKTVTVRLA